MTRPIPVEIREAIVNAYNKKLGTAAEIAAIFSIKPRSVFNFLKKKRETGNLSAEPIPGRPPILTDENLSIIKKIILSNNDGTLEEYRVQFYKETGIDVTIVTIHNACSILDLRRKKKVSTQRNKNEKTSR